jgi:citrate synthase
VTRATLYAYASRGQLHSEPAPGDPKARRYHREDIQRLLERKELRRDPARAAERGLHWGSPLLSSGITLIQDGALYYRGQNALTLAETATLESVAELLWDADASERGRLFDQPCPLFPRQLARLRTDTRDPIALLQMALPLAAAQDSAGHDLRPAAVRRTGARIIRLFATVVAGERKTSAVAQGFSPAIHVVLQRAWAPRNAAVADVLRAALVLCADHELNVSAFTARCVASAGSSPYDTVSAALAALKGPRHGGESSRVSALLAAIGSPARARSVVAARLRQGERIPGFGHPLYPAGDPRAERLVRLAERSGHAREWALARSVRTAAADLLQELPNLDFGLAAVARTYRLPEEAPLVLFALGRTAGWIAHAIEQYATGALIRPRARYTGPIP